MTDTTYVPIIKTSEAEMRAIENLSERTKDAVVPLFELTRSRACKTFKRGDIFRRMEQLGVAFGEERRFFLDLTGDPSSRNEQIESLQENAKGYKNWVRFLADLKVTFPRVVPVVQISDIGVSSEADFYARIRQQVRALDDEFGQMAYRFPLFNYDSFSRDLDEICSVAQGSHLAVIVDADFISRGMAEQYAIKAADVLGQLERFSLGGVVIAGTSFPQNPTEYGDEDTGDIHLEECKLFDLLSERTKARLIYGDYATVNPKRSPQAGGNGWVPRIDMPVRKRIFYYRSRKSKVEHRYDPAYIRVAKRVVADDRYAKAVRKIDECWGIEQIELAADGYPQGLSPSFWISVRMAIHITLRTILLSK